MDKSTLKALNDSIAHWKRHASGTARNGEGIYNQDCALCQKFLESLRPPEPPQIQRKLSKSTLQKFRLENGKFSAAKAKRALKDGGYDVQSARVDSNGNLVIEIKV